MSQPPLRIAFMGTPDFAATALKAILDAGYIIACAYTQPPRPKGRGHKLQSSPVQILAEQNNIPVFHPKSLKSKDVQAEFEAHNLDLAIVAAYGLILPEAILNAPKHGCVNIHASLLPRWRGASPIQRSIWAGDQQSGVTIMEMDEGLDTGDEILKTAINLDARETATTLHDRLAELGASMSIKALNTLSDYGELKAIPQSSEGVTYAHLLNKEDGEIDWSQTAQEIDQQIRALNPWPGTYTYKKNERLKILISEPSPQTSTQPIGTILNKHGHIQCGQNTVLQIQKIQPAGKQAMDFASALNGGYIKIGGTLA